MKGERRWPPGATRTLSARIRLQLDQLLQVIPMRVLECCQLHHVAASIDEFKPTLWKRREEDRPGRLERPAFPAEPVMHGYIFSIYTGEYSNRNAGSNSVSQEKKAERREFEPQRLERLASYVSIFKGDGQLHRSRTENAV